MTGSNLGPRVKGRTLGTQGHPAPSPLLSLLLCSLPSQQQGWFGREPLRAELILTPPFPRGGLWEAGQPRVTAQPVTWVKVLLH